MLKSILKKNFFISLFLFVVSFLIYLPSLNSEFIWDDVDKINRHYYQNKNTSLVKIIYPDERAEKPNYYRPVVSATYYFDYKVWAMNPEGYHLSNIFFHCLCSILLYFLSLLVLKRFKIEKNRNLIAFISTLFFVVHPSHVESVSWVSGRSDVVCSIFLIAAFISHIISRERKYFFVLLTASFLYLALLSKELAVSFSFIVLAFDYLVYKRVDKRSLILFLIYLGLTILYLHIRARAFGLILFYEDLRIFVQAYLMIKNLLLGYFYFLIKLFFPFQYIPFLTEIPGGLVKLMLSILVFLILAIVGLYSYQKKQGLGSFSLLWFVLALGPSLFVMNIVLHDTPIGERYLFFPSAPFLLFLVFSGFGLIKQRKLRFLVPIVGVLFFSVFSYCTVKRQNIWKTTENFWSYSNEITPDHALTNLGYGMVLINDGDFNKGLEKFKDGFKTKAGLNNTTAVKLANNAGNVYLKLGKAQEAKHWYERAVGLNPGFHNTYFHLGLTHLLIYQKGSVDDLRLAEEYFKKTLQMKPHSKSYLYLAKIHLVRGDINLAKENARKAIDLGLNKQLEREATSIIGM